MPELPEVETIARDLNIKLKFKKIISVEPLDKKVFQLSRREASRLVGRKIVSVFRRAKMIIFDLGDDILLAHLKMTGQLVLKSGKDFLAGGHPIIGTGTELPNKFSRVIFKFNDKSTLFFNDVRRFGWVRLLSQDNFLKLSRELGVEPLKKDFTLDYFKEVLSRRGKTKIKQVLLDQKYISGIGNIYADESLYLAGIKPFRLAKNLSLEEIENLWKAIPRILTYAIKHRGTSFSDYVDARGESGNFIKYLKVYGRTGKTCKRCGRPIKKMKLGGRGTHWCDYCQT